MAPSLFPRKRSLKVILPGVALLFGCSTNSTDSEGEDSNPNANITETGGGPSAVDDPAGTGGASEMPGTSSGGALLSSGGSGTEPSSSGGTDSGSGGTENVGTGIGGGTPGYSACTSDPAGTQSGEHMEDFELFDQNGESFKLSDHCDKVVVLVAVGGWCSICRGEAPDVEEFYQENKDRGLMVATMYTERRHSRDGEPTAEDIDGWANLSTPAATHPVLNDGIGGVSLINQYVEEFARPQFCVLGKGARIERCSDGNGRFKPLSKSRGDAEDRAMVERLLNEEVWPPM